MSTHDRLFLGLLPVEAARVNVFALKLGFMVNVFVERQVELRAVFEPARFVYPSDMSVETFPGKDEAVVDALIGFWSAVEGNGLFYYPDKRECESTCEALVDYFVMVVQTGQEEYYSGVPVRRVEHAEKQALFDVWGLPNLQVKHSWFG